MLAVLMMAALTSLETRGQDTAQKQYTKENPLVYEDAWDLWPYVFLNEHGEPQGFNVDMLKLVLNELKIPYIIKLKPTSEALEDMRTGRSDLMMRLAATFHEEYGHYGNEVVQMFTHSVVSIKSKPVKVNTLDDLGRHKVIVHEGSLSHRMMVDHGWENNCIPIGDMKEAIQQISSKGEGYILWNTLSLKWLMKKYHTNDLQITPIDIPSGEYKFYSNDTLLLQRLDSVYASLYATDRIQPILNKWFYPERVDTGIPDWVAYVAAVTGLLVFLLAYYTLNLRIRERKMTKLIAKHNKRLALVLRTTKIRVWLYDVQRKTFVWMNSVGEMEKHEYNLQDFARNLSQESLDLLSNALDQIAKGEEEELAVELISDETAGNRHYLSTLSVFRRSKDGDPTVIIGMTDDQTEQLQVQRKAKDNMLRYQSIFSTSMVDMTYYNSEGILTNINQKACDTFRYSREELLAEHVSFNRALEDMDMTIENFEGCHTTHLIKASSNAGLAESIKFPENVYYEQKLVPVCDASNHFIGIFGSGRDVSEFVNSYHQMKQSVEQLMAAAKDVADYINNINIALHEAGVRLVNYSPHSHILTIFKEMNVVQLKLTQSRCLALVDEKSKRAAIRLLNTMDMFTNDAVDADIKTELRSSGGKSLALQFRFIPIFDKEGKVDSYFGLSRDISEQKATEEELEYEKSKAQEVENIKNVFLRNMSHEIRTPITTVVGFAELFAQEHDPADEDSFIAEIKYNASYLLKLVNDILFLSRLDAHMLEFTKSPIDFAFTFEGHCQMGWAKHTKPGVKYIVENPYEHLIVDIDDSNVGHIIEQTSENAARYTESGYVRTRYDYIGDKLVITIDDTGAGIDTKKQKHLFERFNTHTNQSGTGLGMPICMELAQQMGGAIHVNSAPGRGTTVWIVIPCKATLIEKKMLTNEDGNGQIL